MKFVVVCLSLYSGIILALDGKVIAIHDGDTISVLDTNKVTHKIRLAEIDAPELNQPWGKKSKQALSNLIYQKSVVVKEYSRDAYGRTVGTVLLDHIDINYQQIETGNAWAYRRHIRSDKAVELELIAKRNRLGLWSNSSPIPPWQWRRKK